MLGASNAATEAEFDETFALNVKIPFFLVASLAPAMAEHGWGSIVNVSTMVASFGQAGMALYGASRAALELLTKAWAAEYGPIGVRVNAVAPGPTRTRMMEAVPDEMVNQLAGLAPAGSRGSSPRNLLRRSSSSPVMMPASCTASLLRSTEAGSRHNSRSHLVPTCSSNPANGFIATRENRWTQLPGADPARRGLAHVRGAHAVSGP